MKFATRLSHSNQLQKYIKFQLILMSFENLVSLKDLKDDKYRVLASDIVHLATPALPL